MTGGKQEEDLQGGNKEYFTDGMAFSVGPMIKKKKKSAICNSVQISSKGENLRSKELQSVVLKLYLDVSPLWLLYFTTTGSSSGLPACLFNFLTGDQLPSRCSTNMALFSSDVSFSFSPSEKHVLIDYRELIKIYFFRQCFPLATVCRPPLEGKPGLVSLMHFAPMLPPQ